MFYSLLLIFGLNVVSNTLNTLRTIFLTKRITKPLYIITFLDAVLFVLTMKLATSGDGIWYFIAFASGKVCGVFLADRIEGKLALGLIKVKIMGKKEKIIHLADHLRDDLGYTVNTQKVYGKGGESKFDLDVSIKRKELEFLKETVRRFGFDDPTMQIMDIASVTGKIKTEHHR